MIFFVFLFLDACPLLIECASAIDIIFAGDGEDDS